ncbi:uncharacterized protein LOC131883171 isoform X1 [Tigriopus californicus]|uniref:uncharacterized protein LOC131883171 isoform X1 n=1 Tax=Tigriopus californicus TaxID=6832 RepID=UPI0027DA1BF2|nr:uncharacterized protein LOC131883171 isoform X1 [Tigriopus californicus]
MADWQGRFLLIWLLCLCLGSTPLTLGMDLCSQSFCQCPEAGKEVICTCSNPNQNIIIDDKSVPIQAKVVFISECGSVDIRSNSFAQCRDLAHLQFTNLKELELKPNFYSESELEYKELSNLTVSRIGRVTINPQAFVNFPKTSRSSFHEVGIREVRERDLEILTDEFSLTNSEIGILGRASLYSDAGLLEFKNNRIEFIESTAFDASVRRFEFIGNTIDHIENSGMSVACLNGKIIGNTFHNQTGSPLLDFGPDPVCVPDPEAETEEDMQYNVVANPILEFTDNFFHIFTDDMLNFPGANNVPLGALDIRGNKVKCDCEAIKEFAALVDFEHVVPREHTLQRGALLFRKEFYDSGICVDANGQEQSLKAFARNWIKVVEPGVNGSLACSMDVQQPQRKLKKSPSTSEDVSNTSQKEAFEMSAPNGDGASGSSGPLRSGLFEAVSISIVTLTFYCCA